MPGWPVHFRFVVRGIFDGSPEQWSTSCHFSTGIRLNDHPGLSDVDEGGVTDAVDGWIGSSLFPANVVVTDWRMYVIGVDGKMGGNAPLLHAYANNDTHGSAGAWQLPAQCALVATLVAPNRGPAKYGRMFLPTPNVSFDATGRITIAQATAQAEGVTTLMKQISDSINFPALTSCEGVNVSPLPATNENGTLQVIDHVEVGLVMDTMRSRRTSMLEERHVHGHIDW